MRRLRTTLVAALLVAVVATTVHAEISSQSVCRIRYGERSAYGVTYTKGSGAYLGDRLVLTAAHVVRDAPRDTRFEVIFKTGSQHTGSMVARDPKWDLALLELQQAPTSITPMLLADANAAIGEQVFTIGYDGGDRPVARQGRVLQYTMSSPRDATADWYEISGSVRGGSSGGPVCTPTGYLIGVIWGAVPGRHTTAVQLGRTKRFLLPWNARLEAVRLKALRGGCYPPSTCAPPRRRRPSGGVPTYPSPSRPPASPPAPAPKKPTTRAPVPEDPPTPTPDPVEIEIDYDKLSGMILAKMKENPDTFRGPPGKDGEDGAAGEDGKDARDLTIVQVGPNGNEQTYQPDADGMVRLPAPPDIRDLTIIQEGYNGESLTISPSANGELRLPPVIMRIEHPDGSVLQQTKPLGTPIRVKLVPFD